MKRLIIPIFIPFHGCPERCLYCDQETITGEGKTVVLPDQNKIEDEITTYLGYAKKAEEIEIAFYGGTFTALPLNEQERLLTNALQNAVKKPQAIRVSTHPSYVTTDIIKLLKRHRVETVELGVQSMETKVLQNLGRDYSPESVAHAIQLLKGEGMLVGSQLMLGCPGETRKGFLEGLRILVEAGADFFRLYPLQVFPGTALEKMIARKVLALPEQEETLTLLEAALICLELEERPIIRVGLPESGFSTNSPLHDPSLKHRILSRIALRLMEKALETSGSAKGETFIVHEKKISEYIGHLKENLLALNSLIHGRNIQIKCDNRKNFDGISLETEGGVLEFSRRELLATIYRSYS